MTIKVYIDTNVFIEGFEKLGDMPDIARAVFEIVKNGVVAAVISDLVVAELLVKPLQTADQELIDAYSELLSSPKGYQSCPIDRNTLLEAARQRAINPGTKLPDAIHIATARLHNCKVFLTTETRLRMPHDFIRLNLDASTITDIDALA